MSCGANKWLGTPPGCCPLSLGSVIACHPPRVAQLASYQHANVEDEEVGALWTHFQQGRSDVDRSFRWLQYDTNVTALPLGFLALQQHYGNQLERGTSRASPGAAPGHQAGWTAGRSPAMGTETKIPEDISVAFLLLPGENYSPLLCRQALHSILLTEQADNPVLRVLFMHLFQTRLFSSPLHTAWATRSQHLY